MKTFSFKCKASMISFDATKIITGTAYFDVKAETEEEARKLLSKGASDYYFHFSENDSSLEWEASKPDDWKLEDWKSL